MEPQTCHCSKLPLVRHKTSLKEVFRKETYLTLFSRPWSRHQSTLPTSNGHAPFKKELPLCSSLLCLDLVSFSRVVSNIATDATPGGGALPSFLSQVSALRPYSPQNPTNIDFSEGAEGVTKQTTLNLQSAWFMVKTTTVP